MSGRVYEYPPRTLRRSAIPDGIVIDGRISFQTAPKDSATTFKLDALPVELVQRIAGFCSIKTVLKLAKVNRALHRTCSDQYVFRSILLSGNGRPSPTKLEWYGSKLSLLEDPNTWAAYALADYKASKIESVGFTFLAYRGERTLISPHCLVIDSMSLSEILDFLIVTNSDWFLG